MTLGRATCFAKVNLFLAVGPIDARGYHPVRSIMQTVGLADELEISESSEDAVECDGMSLPMENTLTKTLRLVREVAPVPMISLRLTKRIPSEAGLGGGSSDAAGLIRLLAELYPSALPPYVQQDIAATVGCDVPFFLVGGTAKAEGYGERVSPLPDLAERGVVIVKPVDGVSSKEAYARLDQKSYPWLEFPCEALELHNDFERVAPCVCGEIAERLQIHGCSAAQLTGSGSAVFGLTETTEAAQHVAEAMQSERLGAVFATSFVNRSRALGGGSTWMS